MQMSTELVLLCAYSMRNKCTPHAEKRVLGVKFCMQSCSAGQLALAWVLAQGKDVIPIPGKQKQQFWHANHNIFKKGPTILGKKMQCPLHTSMLWANTKILHSQPAF